MRQKIILLCVGSWNLKRLERDRLTKAVERIVFYEQNHGDEPPHRAEAQALPSFTLSVTLVRFLLKWI